MKNTTKQLLLFITIAISTFNANAQKIAHINYDSLLAKMPERKAAETIYQAYLDSIELKLKQMQTEIEIDYSQLNIELGNNKETTPEQNKKIKQLQERLEEINEYRENVKDESKTKTTALLNPIIAKAKNAIAQVAKENNYNLVIDSSKDTYLYIQGIEDIMHLVLKNFPKAPPQNKHPSLR